MSKFLKGFTSFIKKNYTIFIIGAVFYLLGAVLAFIIKSENILSFYEGIALNFYEQILVPSVSPIKFLIKRVLNLILLYVLILVFSLTKFSLYLNFIFVLYKGFVLSVSLKCLFLCFNFSGVLIFIFLSFIQNVITVFSIILVVVLLRLKDYDKRCNFKSYYIKSILFSFIIAILGIIIEFILLVCIIRPFNFYF